MGALADLTQLNTLGSFSASEQAQAVFHLEVASEVVRATALQPTWQDIGSVDTAKQPIVQGIVLEMARRAVVSARPVVQDTTGPHTVSYARPARQGVYLTDEEKAILITCQPGGTVSTAGGVGSVMMTNDDWWRHNAEVPLYAEMGGVNDAQFPIYPADQPY